MIILIEIAAVAQVLYIFNLVLNLEKELNLLAAKWITLIHK